MASLAAGAALAGLASTAIQTAATFSQAEQQNRNFRKAAESEREAAKIAAEERKASVARESQLFQGSVRASSAARSASGLNLAISGLAAGERTDTNIDTQLRNNIASINTRARTQTVNPSSLAFESGLSGLTATLGLTGTAARLQEGLQ